MKRELLILKHDDVCKLLTLDACIQAMRAALARLAEGQVHQPLRMVVRPPQLDGLLAFMPSYVGGEAPAFGFKAVSVFHHNPARGLDAHQGIVVLVSVETGEPLALLDASAITLLRTAAVSAVATDLLAAKDADDLTIIGTGTQARAHLLAMLRVRTIRRVRVTGRSLDGARKLVEQMAAQVDVPLEACASAADAVRDARIIVTATNSPTPVLRGEWLAPGAHVNAVGACLPSTRELDAVAMQRARLYTDRRESLLNEAGDYLLAQREGAIGPEHLQGELGEVLVGRVTGRTSSEDITLFKSLGMAIEDIASAQLVYAAARDARVGAWVEF